VVFQLLLGVGLTILHSKVFCIMKLLKYSCQVAEFGIADVEIIRFFYQKVRVTFKRQGITKERRKTCNEEIRNLYFSCNIASMIVLRRVVWARHVEHMGKWEIYTDVV